MRNAKKNAENKLLSQGIYVKTKRSRPSCLHILFARSVPTILWSFNKSYFVNSAVHDMALSSNPVAAACFDLDFSLPAAAGNARRLSISG